MRPGRLETVLVLGLLAAILAFGVSLRLEDPLATRIIGAEDPFTHMIFEKEALERGYFGDSIHTGHGMYPPGLHAFSAAFVGISGVSLWDFTRFSPVAFGVIAILGTFVLADRLAGRAAGLTSALVIALMPEHVFRTNLFFPTALDLAILPGLLLAFHLAVDPEAREPAGGKRVCWGAVAFFLALVPPVAFMHPWLVPLFMAPLGLYAALRVLRTAPEGWAAMRAMATPVVLVALATAFAMASRWDRSDSGLMGVVAKLGPFSPVAELRAPPVMLFLVLALLCLGIGLAGVLAMGVLVEGRRRTAAPARAIIAIACAAILVHTARQLAAGPMPPQVSLIHMFGNVTLALATLGLVVALLSPSRLGDLGLSTSVLLFPLTVLNVFESRFLSHRTAVYLGVSLAILCAVGVAFASAQATRLLASARMPRIAAPVAALGCVLLVGGAYAADTPSTWEWYRLYNDDHFSHLEEAVAILEDEPGSRLVIYSWQPNLVLKSIAPYDRIRYAPDLYRDEEKRDKVLNEWRGTTYVLVDKYTLRAQEAGKANLSFLEDAQYERVIAAPDGRLDVHLWGGGGAR